jgi:hypothetical protein
MFGTTAPGAYLLTVVERTEGALSQTFSSPESLVLLTPTIDGNVIIGKPATNPSFAKHAVSQAGVAYQTNGRDNALRVYVE